MEVISKKNNIKQLWSELPNDGSKTAFIRLCADEFKRSERTIRQWWFSSTGHWSVPIEFQEKVIDLLQKKINIQNSKLD